MLNRSKHKFLLLLFAAALVFVLALSVALFAACGDNSGSGSSSGSSSGSQSGNGSGSGNGGGSQSGGGSSSGGGEKEPGVHEHDYDYYEYLEPTCIADGHTEYLHCASCGKYFDLYENEIDVSDTVLPATGEHQLSEWLDGRSATCTQRATRHKQCFICLNYFDEEEYGDLLPHVEDYDLIYDLEPTCTTAGKAHTECVECHTPMTTDIEIPASGHDMRSYYYEPASCTEDGQNEHYHCLNCDKDFRDYDGEEEMSEDEIVIEKLGHQFDNDGKWHTDDERHWHYCERCRQNIDEGPHSGSETCDVCNWVNNPFKVSEFWNEEGKVWQLYAYTGSDAHVEIPAQIDGIPIREIGSGVFANRDDIESITVPEGIYKIWDQAFAYSSITSIELPEGLTLIGAGAFLDCTNLLEVTFPESLTSLGSGIFTSYASSEEISLTTVNWNAANCEVGEGELFADYKNLTTHLTDFNIGANVKTLPDIFGYNTTAAPKINVPTLKVWCELDFEFTYSPMQRSNAKLYAGGEEVDLADLVIPEGVERIGIGTFYAREEDKEVMQSVTLPSTLKSVGEDAFRNNRNVTRVIFNGTLQQWCDIDFSYNPNYSMSGDSNPLYLTENNEVTLTIGGKAVEGDIVIPEGTTQIGFAAFRNQPVTSVTIPSSVTKIAGRAFEGLSLTEAHFGGDLKAWSTILFEHSPLLAAAEDFKLFAMVDGEEREIKGEITIPEGTPTIGENAFVGMKGVTKVNMNTDGALKSIGEYAFRGSGITELVLPDSVETIGYDAFDNCGSLETVYFGKSLTYYGFTFDDCPKLKSFEVAEGNGKYSSESGILYEYNESSGLIFRKIPDAIAGEIVIKEGITSIGDEFRGRTSITSFVLPTTLQKLNYFRTTDIHDNQFRGTSFNGCTSLTSIRVAGENEEGEHFKSYKGVLYLKVGDGRYNICVVPLAIETVEIIEGCSQIERKDFAEWDVSQQTFVHECDRLTRVTLPSSMSTIDNFIFTRCTALETVEFGTNNSIGGNKYYMVYDGILYKNTTPLDEGDRWILFSVPMSITGDVTVLDGVERLDSSDDYTYSEDREPVNFKGRTKLHSVTLPQSLTDIPKSECFYGCSSLVSISIVGGENEKYLTYEGILYKKYSDDSLEVYVVPGGIENVVIHERCTRLNSAGASGVFKNHGKLKTVTLHPGVTLINKDEFSGCSSLEKFILEGESETYKEQSGILYNKNGEKWQFYLIPAALTGKVEILDGITSLTTNDNLRGIAIVDLIIPDSVTTIGRSAFANCLRLESVTIGAGVTSVDHLAFSGCTMLKTVYWNATNCKNNSYYSNDVSELLIFYGCERLSEVHFGPSVERVPSYAFYGLKELKELTIGVPFIGEWAFAEGGLTTLTIDEGAKEIRSCAFENNTSLVNLYVKSATLDEVYSGIFPGCPLGNFQIDESITVLPARLFAGSPLTEFTVPDHITAIGQSAFSGCESLQTVDFGNVTTIGGGAFMECTAFTSIDLNGNIQTVGDSAFSGCTELKTVTIGEKMVSLGAYVFRNCTALTTIYWNAIEGAEVGNRPYEGDANISSIVFGEGVQRLPTGAFNYLEGLKELTVDVPVIASAFARSSLETVTIGEHVKSAQDAFFASENLTTVYWNAAEPEDFEFTACPFADCTALENFIFGASVRHIPSNLLRCEQATDFKLTEITIPEGVTSIGDDAFRSAGFFTVNFNAINCEDIEAGGCPFDNCWRITTFNIGDRVTRIPAWLLSSVVRQQWKPNTIVVPESVQEIGECAFSGLSSDLVVGTTVKQFGGRWFSYDTKGDGNGGHVYYLGDEEDLANVTFDSETGDESSFKRHAYYFSTEQNSDGRHWHWQDDDPETGIPVLWE